MEALLENVFLNRSPSCRYFLLSKITGCSGEDN